MTDSAPMTKRGYELLRDELKHLKSIERPKVVLAIEEARGHGDLSENAEYDEAKQAQGLLEAKINDLEHMLAHAQVIDTTTLSGDKVMFGATVSLVNMDTDQEVTYRLVGAYESDVKQGLLSIESPIARALIGKRQGDLVRVKTPGGQREYEVAEVRFE